MRGQQNNRARKSHYQQQGNDQNNSQERETEQDRQGVINFSRYSQNIQRNMLRNL